MPLHDVRTNISEQDGKLVLAREQDLPDSFMDSLKSQRLATAHIRAGEMHHVASVPAAVFDLWIAQGIPAYSLTPREIVARLKKDNLEAFIVTSKTV